MIIIKYTRTQRHVDTCKLNLILTELIPRASLILHKGEIVTPLFLHTRIINCIILSVLGETI